MLQTMKNRRGAEVFFLVAQNPSTRFCDLIPEPNSINSRPEVPISILNHILLLHTSPSQLLRY